MKVGVENAAKFHLVFAPLTPVLILLVFAPKLKAWTGCFWVKLNVVDLISFGALN